MHADVYFMPCAEFLTAQYVPNSQDQSSKHQGRKRQFPHIEANFATHVYIEGDRLDMHACMQLCNLGIHTSQLLLMQPIYQMQLRAPF